MAKHGFLTPKAIANRMKAKGLQKPKWYCQMCRKQCRDENGFKCHCMSESHQRQMQLFGQNPNQIINEYSNEFELTFLDHMKRTHQFRRVAAKAVYDEYIKDRHHVHMNATRWVSLTEFVKYLGKMGKCKVEETAKGWFVTYVDRGVESLWKEKMKKKRARADVVEEEKQARDIKRQIESAKEQYMSSLGYMSLVKEEEKLLFRQEEEKISVSIVFAMKNVGVKKLEVFDEVIRADNVLYDKKGSTATTIASIEYRADNMLYDKKGSTATTAGIENRADKVLCEKKGRMSATTGTTALDELMEEEEMEKERSNRKDYWLCEGIVVKVMSKDLGDAGCYKKKGVVCKMIDKYVGEIEMIERKCKVRVDQEELETVIPQIGGTVRVVNGAYRGLNARLLGVDTERFCATVQIEKGLYEGRVIQDIEYEDICKVV